MCLRRGWPSWPRLCRRLDLLTVVGCLGWLTWLKLLWVLAPDGAVVYMSGVARQQGPFFWIAKRKVPKKNDPCDSAPSGFPALLVRAGWLQELASLKHPYAETPALTAMLGTAGGEASQQQQQQRKSSVRKVDWLSPPPRHSRVGGNPVRPPTVALMHHEYSVMPVNPGKPPDKTARWA
ncbi:hypothetical protein HNQ50_000405 [Silvimonas terrae]|uniref:Uncharacterized protein n=1 Tax=Silvimonas terrae TaxID=300266 RepID=A0A840R8P2_9NEIS|nr:hypothetical protein [Silvimonas terrae]